MRTSILATAALAALVAIPANAAEPVRKTVVVKHVVNPDGTVSESSTTSTGNGDNAAAAKLVENCAGHKFETIATTGEGEHKRETRIKLCGKPGASDAEWATTLRDAKAKIEASSLPAPSKAQIVSQLDLAINRATGTPESR